MKNNIITIIWSFSYIANKMNKALATVTMTVESFNRITHYVNIDL